MGRATQGVRLIILRDEDAIASVAKVEVDESQDDGEDFDDILDEEITNGDDNQ